MLTGVAARLNEVKQRQNFSVKHFLGVAACGFRQVWNNSMPWAMVGTQRWTGYPGVCYPAGGCKWGLTWNNWLFGFLRIMWQFCHVVFWDKETVKNNWYCFKPVCRKTVSLFQGITAGVFSCKNPENFIMCGITDGGRLWEETI